MRSARTELDIEQRAVCHACNFLVVSGGGCAAMYVQGTRYGLCMPCGVQVLNTIDQPVGYMWAWMASQLHKQYEIALHVSFEWGLCRQGCEEYIAMCMPSVAQRLLPMSRRMLAVSWACAYGCQGNMHREHCHVRATFEFGLSMHRAG